jgi:2-keto-3-deoxy-L-fuconate dehydrogenase
MFKLTNKSVVITGGGSGIGKAMCVLFAQQGAHVHIIELNDKAAADTVAEITTANGKATGYACDVSNSSR